MESLKTKIYYAAKKGMSVALCDHLASLSDKECSYILDQVVEEDDQKCTPLLIAARNGHDKAVRALLKFHPDIEQEGTIKIDGYIIDGAPPLWCAAGAGYLSVVKLLVRAGADINHLTHAKSTPLRAACFNGRLDIVKYLTDHNANIHIKNSFNNTCLMIAAYRGHADIVQFLLELGANPNETAKCGASALHFASECGHIKIVELLLSHGAEITKNESDMTPYIMAAERTRADVVEYFISRPEVTKEEKIDALELLGASFGSDKDNYSLESAYKYMSLGMKERYSDPENIIEKPRCAPIPAYENRIECRTMEELDGIQYMSHIIYMESLAIRERILGPHNPEVPHPVIFRGAVFADNARFDRCLQLWLHALRLKQLNKVSAIKDLLRFAQLFSQMIYVGVSLEFDVIKEALEATVVELERNQLNIKSSLSKPDLDSIKDEIESSMVTSLYLIIIALRVAKGQCQTNPKPAITAARSGSGIGVGISLGTVGGSTNLGRDKNTHNELEVQIHHIVYRLVRVGARTASGQTLLHLVVNPETAVDEFHTNHVCKFPCAITTKLLIACGANVNDMDNNRNTPLHLIVPYDNPVRDFFTLHNIIMALIEGGAHMDTVNQKGNTPFESATTGVAEVILRSQKKPSLKCQAARVVKANGIPYQGQVPKHLEAFIELHGPGHVDVLQPKRKEQQF